MATHTHTKEMEQFPLWDDLQAEKHKIFKTAPLKLAADHSLMVTTTKARPQQNGAFSRQN